MAPIVFAYLAQVTHYLPAVTILKNSVDWKILALGHTVLHVYTTMVRF